jgi:hypothetical protein
MLLVARRGINCLFSFGEEILPVSLLLAGIKLWL